MPVYCELRLIYLLVVAAVVCLMSWLATCQEHHHSQCACHKRTTNEPHTIIRNAQTYTHTHTVTVRLNSIQLLEL